MSNSNCLNEYAATIKQALRLGGITEKVHERRLAAVTALSKFKIHSPSDVCSDLTERLFDWPEQIFGSKKNGLTQILGETRFRNERDKLEIDAPFPMTGAATSDGVAACNILSRVLASSALAQSVTTKTIIDEWICEGQTEVSKSHLVVIGSGEVNLAALFLNGLVNEFYYGASKDVPFFDSMGNTLHVGGRALQRQGQGDSSVRNYGAVLLLRNPWNPEFRLLWVSGLTGKATTAGGSLVQNSWIALSPEAREQGEQAIGLVFEKTDSGIVPRHWMVRNASGVFHWEDAKQSKVSPEHPTVVESKKRFHVFLSYNANDRPMVRQLRTKLEKRGLQVWYDEKELRPGLDWHDCLEANIQSCESVAICVGASGVGAWENLEMKAYLRRCVEGKKSGKTLPVIPVLLPGTPADIELPTFLENFTMVDMRDGFAGDKLDAVVWGITGKKPN